MAAPRRVLFSWVLPDGNTTGQILVDCTVRESHEKTAQVTDHQVESGEPVADHVRPMPQRLTVEGILTNTPLDANGQPNGVSGSVQSVQVATGITVKVFTFDSEFDKVREAYGNLLDAIEAGAEFTITTTLARYETFVFEGITVPRDTHNSNNLRFTAQFRHVRIVETQTIAALPSKLQRKKQGAKTGKQLDPKTDQKKIDALTGIVNALKNAYPSIGGGG